MCVLQEVMGVLIGSAVAPIAMCLCWKKTNKWGAVSGAVLGQWLGLAAWLIFAKVTLVIVAMSLSVSLGGESMM